MGMFISFCTIFQTYRLQLFLETFYIFFCIYQFRMRLSNFYPSLTNLEYYLYMIERIRDNAVFIFVLTAIQ